MKKVYLYLVAILLVIGGMYAWRQRHEFSFLRDYLPSRTADGVIQLAGGKSLDWRPVDESNLGFRVDMPGEPKRVVVQATSENGTPEPVNMLLVKPEPDKTYAVAWAEKPPVARMNDLAPDKTLDQARDGALYRTSTTLRTEIRTSPQGYPGRDIVAHNAGGGILDTRFVYAGTRLYMLIAASPSPAARRENDIDHFFNSFVVAASNRIPETLPAATQ